MSHVAVIGGGVIGVACAYYLSRSGWQVTLLDRGRIGGGCSHANCGFVSPSHVLPLAEPGAIRRVLRAMLKRDSPFYIKPRPDPALWGWLIRFARRCNTADMLAGGRACHALLESSRTLYPALFSEEQIDCEWEPRGLLFVCQTRPALDHFAATDALLAKHFNLPARRIEGESLGAFEPALLPGMAGGYFYEEDAPPAP